MLSGRRTQSIRKGGRNHIGGRRSPHDRGDVRQASAVHMGKIELLATWDYFPHAQHPIVGGLGEAPSMMSRNQGDSCYYMKTGTTHPNYNFGSSVIDGESPSLDASFAKHSNMVMEDSMAKTQQTYQLYDKDQNPVGGRVFSPNGEAPTNRTAEGGNTQPKISESKLRIRKLTPRECWRLMGVKDKDFDKLEGKFSDSTLYHLAGDSIVVPVLMEIFNRMMPNPKPEKEVFEEFKEEWMEGQNGTEPDDMYNPYNDSHLKNVAPTQTSATGTLTTSATVLLKEKE